MARADRLRQAHLSCKAREGDRVVRKLGTKELQRDTRAVGRGRAEHDADGAFPERYLERVAADAPAGCEDGAAHRAIIPGLS